ncbi:MAG TPA: CHRD domain-containing protein [Nitrososphaeraceae archaeon]
MKQNQPLFAMVLFVAVLSVGTVSIVLNVAKVQAQEGQTFSATLSGKDEVPPTESNSTGTAKFQVNNDSSQVSYWVNITGIKKITQAHIHNGTSGQNGDVVVTLSKEKSAKGKETSPAIGFAGNITKDDLQGPLKGKEVSDLVSLMSNGSAYVNAHTDKYPKGAIRGQISSGVAEMQATGAEGSSMANGDVNTNSSVAEQGGNITADNMTQSGNTTLVG